jgi:2-polyprenyl-3-methyl-5-hydroxy-6-metoxy-1,4-benzoquinol methylase
LTTLDRLLQRWRIAVAAPWIPPGARVLDVGCADGRLFEVLRDRIAGGVDKFDAITMLAVLEHMPASSFAAVGAAAARLLRDGGRLIVTVPEPAVDRIVELLQLLRLAEGMSLEQHHGFSPAETRGIFEPHGLRIVRHRRFQLGLNNLFVFERSGAIRGSS